MHRKATPEGVVKASIRHFIKQFVPSQDICLKAIVGGPLQSPGIADYLGCYKGKAIAIEVKAPNGKQSYHQEQFQREWESAGGLYVLARSWEDVAKALEIKGLIF